MSAFDIIFLFCILITILAGIALGFHTAYRIAEAHTRNGDNDSYAVRPKSAETKCDRREEDDEQFDVSGGKTQKKSRLHDKIKGKKKMSFSIFDCQFTGEEPTEKLERARAEQDAAYNCLESRVGKP